MKKEDLMDEKEIREMIMANISGVCPRCGYILIYCNDEEIKEYEFITSSGKTRECSNPDCEFSLYVSKGNPK